jgi:hypothetical protein
MSERSPDRPSTAPRADATRDIRLPPLPGRPAPAVPAEWSSSVPAGTPTADGDAPPRGPVDEPTDRLAPPSSDPLRQRTRDFSPPPPAPRTSVPPARRRGTTVLWTLVLVTVAVIVACGVYLVIVVTQR